MKRPELRGPGRPWHALVGMLLGGLFLGLLLVALKL